MRCRCLLLLMMPLGIVQPFVIQVPSTEQANQMVRKMVDDAVEYVRQKYRLEKEWKMDRDVKIDTEMKMLDLTDGSNGNWKEMHENGHKARSRKHHHRQHYQTDSQGHMTAKAMLNYSDEKMRLAKSRGKQLIEALGVKEDGEVAEKRIGPITMKSLFGKFTRRD